MISRKEIGVNVKVYLTGALVFMLAHALNGQQVSIKAEPSRSSLERTQSGKAPTYVLHWEGITQDVTVDGRSILRLMCDNASVDPWTHLPVFRIVREVSASIVGSHAEIVDASVSRLSVAEADIVRATITKSDFEVRSFVRQAGRKNIETIEILPLKKSGGSIDRLEAFSIKVDYEYGSASRAGRSSHWKAVSVLNTGQWFKMATGVDGVYKVTGKYLKECGFEFGELPSSSVRLYGIKSGELNKDNSEFRPDDLREISIKVVDGGDGVFNDGDYFMFYGEDQINWQQENFTFSHSSNPYSDSAYYFVTIDGGFGTVNRILASESNLQPNRTVSTYDYYVSHENDISNLIKSGREWFGEPLGTVSFYDFGFTVPDVDRSIQAHFKLRFAMRSVNDNSPSVSASISGQGFNESKSVPAVPSGYAVEYARADVIEAQFLPRSSNFFTKISLNYGQNSSAQAWIDYLEIVARRSLIFIGPQMNFRDRFSVGVGNISEFRVNTVGSEIEVWDVTNIYSVQDMKLSGNASSGYRFLSRTDTLKEYIAFKPDELLIPTKVGWVQNQNLHSITSAEYVVVSHHSFIPYAQRLADYHATEGMSTLVVDVDQIYNEFSGGAQDITAIREFLRMMYTRGTGSSDQVKYLLLFGDASYDYKNRISGNSNFVPSYQTKESLVPTQSVVSDDYFGLLSDDEAEATSDLVDIGIGRLPARTKSEAELMVNKILHYTSPATFGDWRNWIALVADDPEGKTATFQNDASSIGDIADQLSPEFNFDKIYLDGFQQIAGSGGERYPDATDAISDRIRKGALIVYYIGHGGELGWAHERVLEVQTINKWTNFDNMPLFVTATCEFTRFDDPRRTSAGEYVMLNPSGGGVALLTTTRAVFSGPNFELTKSFTEQAFQSLSDAKPRLGDMTMNTKIENASSSGSGTGLNSRCFTLIGDPAMKLAFPQKRVIVTSMPDTIKALDKVKVSGYIANLDSTMINGFNGVLYPTIFDKVSRIQGQNNDGEGTFFWTERRNTVFRGKASVKNGKFDFEFVVPKDINRTYGGGKLSFYADNGAFDANGAYFEYQIGGLSDNPIVDNDGPITDLFMNNNKFVFGGMTNDNPDLYAEIWDENGVNMVGTGIGHDITAVLDKKAANTLVLNDFYEADIDSYQSGKIKYPFNDLNEGQHNLSLEVWDVNNNPSEAYTEFVVANDAKLALDHVLNYPNPFTTNTDFYFEHNKPGLGLEVRIEIFTISGKLVKTLDGVYSSNGFRVGPINWNGRDEYGDLIGKGVYLYRVKVKTPSGDSAEEYERLVILK
ncbi:MAG: type IX secretion system sortase PorU [Flavobacteriales bacterium]